MKRRFPGAFIPSEVWLSEEMSWAEKMYLTEIDLLDADENGCYASNKYLGGFFHHSTRKAGEVIKELEKKKYIISTYDNNSKRHIKVIHPAFRGEVYRNGVLEIVESKGRKEIDEMKDLRRIAREYFFKLYGFKAREMTGRYLREDGRPISPPWTGKEGALLKEDFKNHGLAEMKRLMLLFFTDRISEVSDFTRYKEKAGYSYTVFHGMLSKLVMSNKTVKEPCMECGGYKGHYPECRYYIPPEKVKEVTEEEIEEGRKMMGDNFSLMDMVNKHRKEKAKTN